VRERRSGRIALAAESLRWFLLGNFAIQLVLEGLKGLLGHKLRLALTVLAITIGVGFVAGSFVFTDTLGSVFDDLFSGTTVGIDVTIRPTIQTDTDFGFSLPEKIPRSVLDDVREVDGVEEATGSLFWFVQLLDKNGEITPTNGPPTFGASWADTDRPGAFSLRDGARPAADGQVALDRKTAERLGYVVGDTVPIIIFETPESFTLVGLAGFGDADNLGGARFPGNVESGNSRACSRAPFVDNAPHPSADDIHGSRTNVILQRTKLLCHEALLLEGLGLD